MGRALSEGKAPTIPALHWAITSAGCEMMNSGAPTAGRRSLCLRNAGNAIVGPFTSFTDKPPGAARAREPLGQRVRATGCRQSDASGSRCEPSSNRGKMLYSGIWFSLKFEGLRENQKGLQENPRKNRLGYLWIPLDSFV